MIRVPAGTAVFDSPAGVLLGDLVAAGETLVVAEGGRGGRGNAVFRTPTNQAPRRAESGEPGTSRELRLELRLLADAGLLGFPNAGKSSFIARVSAARPRIADYPFTTLIPNLGMVRLDTETEFVIADLPGIITGASEGAGLGIRFLKHLSRTAFTVFFVDVSDASGRDPVADFHALRKELDAFGAGLAAKPAIVVGNKIDLPTAPDRVRALRQTAEARGLAFFSISAATGCGCREVVDALAVRVPRDGARPAEAGST